MKQFLSFVKKEFYHIWRDKRTLFILLGMPIVQITIFGFALTTEVKNSTVGVWDQSKDIATSEITNEIDASQYFDITAILHNRNDVNEVFRKGIAKLVIVFPSNFY